MGARTVASDDEDEYEEQGVQDNEAEIEDEDPDDEEDEEGQDEYEKDDFIVDDVEEEPEEEDEVQEASDEEIKAKKKKRKKRDIGEEYELDEDDYMLLKDAGIKGVRAKTGDKKKFKRLKKAGRAGPEQDRGGHLVSSDAEEEEEGGKRGRTEEELSNHLFGDQEGHDDGAEEEQEEEEEEDIGEYDDMADFIVDTEELDENGQPIRKRPKNKRAHRQAPGVSSSALLEAQEIFGDVSELLEERRIRLQADNEAMDEDVDTDNRARLMSMKRLEKEFEPSILEEKYMTTKDDKIREKDVPERIQLLMEVTGPFPPSETISREAKWIYDRISKTNGIHTSQEFAHILKVDEIEIVKQIANVLQLLHDQKLEVPFIAMYRKELCIDLLKEDNDTFKKDGSRHMFNGNASEDDEPRRVVKRHKVLWAVQIWDKKWLLLQRRKTMFCASYEKRGKTEAQKDPEKNLQLNDLLEALDAAQFEHSIDDLDAKFQLHFPPDEHEAEQGQFKRPKRRSLYSVCRKAGLKQAIKYFGLSPEQFGQNLEALYKKHEVEDSVLTPEEVASQHLNGVFSDSLSVLRGARHMVAVEISTEPAVREYVRNLFLENSVISTNPTMEGKKVIDNFHKYADVTWLCNKPIEQFRDAQWLLIQKAEEEKLLEVTLALPNDKVDIIIEKFEQMYLSDGVSISAQQWNEQRKQILKDSLTDFLFPLLEKEMKNLLSARAKHWIITECGNQLWKWVSVAPFVHPNLDPDEDGSRVIACCWGPGNPATTFVMLDADGEIVDTLHTGHLTIRVGSAEQQQLKTNDQQRLLQFMRDHQPHVMVLGASNLSCRFLFKEMHEAVFKVVEDYPRDLAEGIDIISTEYGDDTLPQLYENSPVSEEQLQQQPGIVRRAVALGRHLQNPLAMVATLCGPGKEILSLKLHPLQYLVNDDEIYEEVERIMITITNQVGIDLNLAASHEWLFAPLQFVSGLGPRKAAFIKRAIQGAGRIVSRKEIMKGLDLMKRNVFINAAGFIRIRGSGQAAGPEFDPLDDTRIHPESYSVAKHMAELACSFLLEKSTEDLTEEDREMAVEHVRDNVRVLKQIVIEEYADEVEEKGYTSGKKLELIKDIQQELQCGYRDWRVKHQQPGNDVVFYWLTGESEESLCEEKNVDATVRKVQQSKVFCSLECGLQATLLKENLSDERDISSFPKVHEGDVLTCRVLSIDKANFSVELTCKRQRENPIEVRKKLNPYYNPPAQSENSVHKERKKSEDEKRRSYKHRMIVHPQFQNISMTDAVQVLAEKEVGDVIFRPSSQGPSHLSMTLKFYDGLYVHGSIDEKKKDTTNLTSFLRLGETLKIGNEEFDDLDEVIARYVDPLVTNWREVVSHRKFRHGKEDEVNSILEAEKKENPMRIVYCFSLSYKHPGTFRLTYIRNTTPHSVYVYASPKGFSLQGYEELVFENPNKLIAHFQKHINDNEPPRRAPAAFVPRGGTEGWSTEHANNSFGMAGSASNGWDNLFTSGTGGVRSSGWDMKPGGRGNSRAWGRGHAVRGGGSGMYGRSGWQQEGGGWEDRSRRTGRSDLPGWGSNPSQSGWSDKQSADAGWQHSSQAPVSSWADSSERDQHSKAQDDNMPAEDGWGTPAPASAGTWGWDQPAAARRIMSPT